MSAASLSPPPLSLYVHIPWCAQKCPYCDFNSHTRTGALPEREYLRALRLDLESELALIGGRSFLSVFFGGGTPSLFAADTIAVLLEDLRTAGRLSDDAEITLEANPGTAEAQRFAGYRQAGVNRLSIGVQSFHDRLLRGIGRIHDGTAARRALELARDAGFDDFNIDLMYGLPGQSPDLLLEDLRTALSFQPPHLSWYQLTIEPNTVFYTKTPSLPAAERVDDAWLEGVRHLTRAGFRRYEISAWSRPGKRCRHNLNYWQFGDYVGIGAGAHGKLTTAHTLFRTRKPRQPDAYMATQFPAGRIATEVPPQERAQEFLMNQLRLFQPFDSAQFEARTGRSFAELTSFLTAARGRGLMEDELLQPTAQGYRFLDELLTMV